HLAESPLRDRKQPPRPLPDGAAESNRVARLVAPSRLSNPLHLFVLRRSARLRNGGFPRPPQTLGEIRRGNPPPRPRELRERTPTNPRDEPAELRLQFPLHSLAGSQLPRRLPENSATRRPALRSSCGEGW